MTDDTDICPIRDPKYESQLMRIARIDGRTMHAIECAEREIVLGKGFPYNSESVYPALTAIDQATWQYVIDILSKSDKEIQWKKVMDLLHRQRTYRSGLITIVYTVFFHKSEFVAVRLHEFIVGQQPTPRAVAKTQIISETRKSQMTQTSGASRVQMG